MAASFDRWEKDPFFSAAEEVQESADRMESTYRTWIHESKDELSPSDQDEIRRDLQTALGTAKWQLEEFERAVKSSYTDNSGKDAKTRHCQFIDAISNQIATVENSLRSSASTEDKSKLQWVRLDEGERDELALFLTGFSIDGGGANNAKPPVVPSKDKGEFDRRGGGGGGGIHGDMMLDCSKNSCHSEGNKEDKSRGHRRTASAADVPSWQIAVADDDFDRKSFDGQPAQSIPRIVSFGGFLNTMESTTKIKSSKNGFRKWKLADRHQAEDTLPLQSNQLARDIDACYERSKSCLDSCDESYNKHLYGWLGALQRQLQRSQYQIQYSRPVQAAMWISLALCMLVIFALRAI